MKRSNGLAVLVVSAAMAAVGVARADVFNMPSGETSLKFVTVGDPNNPENQNTYPPYGSVGYVYDMGKYDVTIGQYCQFLNAVAATDAYGLYNSNMALGAAVGCPTVGIAQSGSPGSYTYSVSYNSAAWSTYATNYPSLYPSASAAANDCPAYSVNWGEAARFCNWLQNGQPAGPEGVGTTETGAYTLDGDTSNLLTETRNAGAKYFLPTDTEWYKAAYYSPSTGAYWMYPTQSNTVPSNALSATGTNNANFSIGTSYTDPTNWVTPVGVFAGSPGPFGTYDMGGDVNQWEEETFEDKYRILRGGAWDGSSSILANVSDAFGPSTEEFDAGFRVTSVPWGWHDPGDSVGDGLVDINDLTIVLSNFGKSGCAWSQGCMDGDPAGTVDVNDLTIVLANFGTNYGASSGIHAVPEPSCTALLGVGAVSLLAIARRRQCVAGNLWRTRPARHSERGEESRRNPRIC